MCLCVGGGSRGGGERRLTRAGAPPMCHALAGGGDFKNPVVNAIAEYSPVSDKIFILRAGTVTTFHTVVLVWFTGILSKYACTLMIVKNIELKLSQPKSEVRLSLRSERSSRNDCGQRLTMSLVSLPTYTIWGGGV